MPPRRPSRAVLRTTALALGMCLGSAASACTINPLTGKRELALISESEEIELGRDLDGRVIGSIGLYPDPKVAQTVARVGHGLAARSERPGLKWQFRVVDDPGVNAFALPGGFVYVTRGLLTHLQSEAQLAAVLGHEIGHVTARHSVNQISRAAVASTGAGLLRIIDPAGEHLGGLAERGVEDLILRHSREDEIEADDLAVRYLKRASIDPRVIYGVLDTVDRTTTAAGGRRVPDRQSTHPDPAYRLARLEAALGPVPEPATPPAGQDAEWLRGLDGMLFGENAREGFFAGTRFVHPILGVQIDFPAGWPATHRRASAMTISPEGEALVFLTLSEHPTAERAHAAFFAQTGLVPGEAWPAKLGDMALAASWFSLRGERSSFVGIAAFVQNASHTFELFSLVTVQRAAEHGPSLEATMRSFAPIVDPAHRAVEAMHVRMVELGPPTDLAHVAASRGSTVDLRTLAILNQVQPDQILPTGTLVKLVQGFRPTPPGAP